jgi:putative ABC transport system permease protein
VPLSLRLALRELRGGFKGFRVFVLCLALGVAAVAGVGSLSEALVRGLDADGRQLLGGDVELRLTHRPATAAELAYMRRDAEVSRTVEMRAMARVEDGRRRLVELKAVDGSYPLYGAVELAGGMPLTAALAKRPDGWGAVAEPALLRRLGLAPGDRLRVGELDYVLRAAIAREPDRGAESFVLGPRLMVADASLAGTGLVQEGSLIRYHYRLKLSAGVALQPWLERLQRDLPEAGWRVRDIRNGAPGLKRFIDRMRLYLTLVGLSTLLVGGLGVANAVRSHLEARARTIAILKCLGAPNRLVYRVYLLQVMLLAAAGVLLGLAAGAATPPLLSGLVAQYLPFEARLGIYLRPLLLAALYGLLTALAFALWPLGASRRVPAGALLRGALGGGRAGRDWRAAWPPALAFLLLALAAVAASDDRWFAIWFVIAAAASLAAFRLAAAGIMALVRGLGSPRRPGPRLALANLHRPGTPTVPVLLSFGIGLTVLIVVGQLEGNLRRQVSERLPAEAPAFFFIDIQPDQVAEFTRLAHTVPTVSGVETVPMLRGRITRLAGRPADQAEVDPSVAWVLRGDRGLTYASRLPENADVVAGSWWPADYRGPQLVSIGEREAAGLGLKLGDSLTVNVLGREVTATVANLRRIDWSTFGMNFVLVFSPGVLAAAPHSFIAVAYVPRDGETALETAITDRFPNVSAIRVREALESANDILAKIAVAVRAAAMVTLAAGVLVLAGALAAGQRRRIYEAVILKVLGGRRLQVLAAYLMEYAILGLAAAAVAAAVGSLAAYVIVTRVMQASWVWLPGTVLGTAGLSVAITVLFGLAGTWAALTERPAPHLRNE